MIFTDDHVNGLFPRIGWVLFRLFCVVAGARIIKAVYRPATDEDAPSFATHWRKNAREAIFGVVALGLLFYVLEGENITITGIHALFVVGLLIISVTGETILGHWGEALDAIETLPGPLYFENHYRSWGTSSCGGRSHHLFVPCPSI